MKLFLYYISHSFVNILKRAMKSWLAIIIVCMVVGIVMGICISLASDSDKEESAEHTATVEIQGDAEAEISGNGDASTAVKETGVKKALHDRGLSKIEVIDLAVSLAFFVQLAISIMGSKNAGKLFQPGDVPMLFASPLKPQSVMLFRLTGSLAASMLITVYMLFQLPNLIYNVNLGTWGAVSIVVVYGLFLIFGTLIQVTFYTITSRMQKKVNINNWLIGFFAVVVGAFAVYAFATGQDVTDASFGFFANKYTYFVPFWGWMRGVCHYAIIGEVGMSLMYLALTLFAFALLILFIWNMKADFYEDALLETDRKAKMIEEARASSSGGIMTRERNRSEKMDRDGFRYGSGSMVFFYKTLFNRFRLAYFKLFSKTMLVYLIIAGGASILVRYKLETNFDIFLIPVFILGGMVFYRTLGNPLREDTSREFFVLIPASPMEKLWCSMLGGVCVTAIDLSIPFILSAVITGASVSQAITWFLFILSIDLFGTATGTFINVSVPGETGQTLKTMAQIMFLYFGLLPSVVFIIVGMLLHVLPMMLLIGTACNVALAALFILFTPHFLVNR